MKSAHWSIRRWVSGSKLGRSEGKRVETGALAMVQSSLQVSGEERKQVATYTPWARRSKEAVSSPVGVAVGTQPRVMMPPLSGGHHCQEEKQSHETQPPTLSPPELAAGPRKNCSSECQAEEHIICNHEKWRERSILFFPERQRHSVAIPNDKGRDTELRQLRYDCHHHKEEAKPQKHHPISPSLSGPHISQLHCLEVSGCRGQLWTTWG